MRTILALAALVTAFHPTSDACGWMPPQVEIHRVTHHFGEHGRSFVIVGDAPKVDDSRWLRVSPQTYDYTMFAELAPEAPRTFTLVGPSGVRVVTATHRVALNNEWELGNRPRTALELPSGTFEVALPGRVDHVKWHALEYDYTTTQHTDIGLDISLTPTGYQIATSGKIVTSGPGRVRGILDVGRDRFIVEDLPDGREPQAVYFGVIASPRATS